MLPPKANNRLSIAQSFGNCQTDITVFKKLYFIFQTVDGKSGSNLIGLYFFATIKKRSRKFLINKFFVKSTISERSNRRVVQEELLTQNYITKYDNTK